MTLAEVRQIFLYPEASQVLSALLPALESHILAPHQLLAVAFPADQVEESGFGIWVPAPELAPRGEGDGPHNTRVLLPWRFVATMTAYDDPGLAEAGRHQPIGFNRAKRVG
jgi:hypothetical protein